MRTALPDAKPALPAPSPAASPSAGFALPALLTLVVLLAGCSPMHPFRAFRAAPTEVGEWALEQHDLGRIQQAREHLQEQIRPSDPDRQATADALQALLAIHRKLATGWPGLEATAELSAHGEDAQAQADFLLRRDYFFLARLTHEAQEVRDGTQYRMFRDAFRQVQPDADHALRRRAWLSAGWQYGLVDPDSGVEAS